MYLFGSLLFLLIGFVILVFGIGLPVLAGVLVYQDATKRTDCSPWLWALAAALAPCLIGVIVYLVVRKDYPLKEEAAFQQMQGGVYGENPAYGMETAADARSGLPTWAKALIIIVCVIVAVCLIALVISVIRAVTGAGMMYYSHDYGF